MIIARRSGSDTLADVPPQREKSRLERDVRAVVHRLASSAVPREARSVAAASTARRLREELEAIASEHAGLLYGRCATLAIALHRMSHLPIYGIVGFDDEVESEVLVHAYIRLDDETRLDVRGPRALSEIYADFEDDPAFLDADEVVLTEGEVAKLATGSTRCPSLREVTPVARRIWEIAEQLRLAR